MSDEQAQVVPEVVTSPVTEPQTAAVETKPTTLSRDEIAAIIDEKFSGLAGNIPSRQDLEEMLNRAKQSGGDKRKSAANKELAGQMKAIDSAVKMGFVDAETAQLKKQDLLTQHNVAQATQEEEVEETPPPTPKSVGPESPQAAAARILAQNELKWDDMPEYAGGTKLPPFEQFITTVAGKVADKKVAASKEAWLKEYESKTAAVRAADAAGATKTVVVSAPAEKKIKRTLDDADDLGEEIQKAFFDKRQ